MAKALGLDDSVTTCDCCGKSNLKHTVVIELDDGVIVHYGSVCATRNTGKPAKQIKSEINAEQQRIIDAAKAEYYASEEYKNYDLKMKMRPSNLIGIKAKQFILKEICAADCKRVQIAEKFGIQSYQII